MRQINYFTDIKEYMRFIMNYEGELKLKNNQAYNNNDLVAIFIKDFNKVNQ